MIYFDIRKAFDCVPHLRLLQKLDQLGTSGMLHSCVQSFLTKRTLKVKFGVGYSKFIEVTSGVPHGSVLGPASFFLCINGCSNDLSCDAVMFEDDVKMCRTIQSPSDVQSLQNDINQLSTWSQRALMSFNTDKCAALWLHPQQAKDSYPQYQLNGERLRCVSRQCDLSVIVDETHKPNHQCADANSIMRTIKASFIDITPALFHKLYRAFILPHLEYSFQAWRPWLKKDIELLEDVQRRSNKLVKCLKDSEYEERVLALHISATNIVYL